jgi:formamidopyrimidine-DNA glycosylase
MPEMPEVQTILEDLKQACLIGKKILKMSVFWDKTIISSDISSFVNTIKGQVITGLDRRGKYLIIHLSNGHSLVIHFRMTGRFILTSTDTPLSPYIRFLMDLDQNMQLRFHDTRKFGRCLLTQNVNETLSKLGPEPFASDLSPQLFAQNLIRKKRALKPLLLDQTFLAGLGNIYVDEALWEAHLHPLQQACCLSATQAETLFKAIQKVLRRGLESQGTTLGIGKTNFYRLSGKRGSHQTLLNVFRREGKPCPRCQTPIIRTVVAQRGTHLCPHCQILKN